jgi:anaerobic ribonucleoside-triphosphate reductase activating protein
MKLTLRLGGIEYHNKTSAPWLSTEIFLKGCYKNCPGCFNQELRDSNGASEVDVDELVQSLIEHVPYKCVTLSGGEPMLQARELITLTEKLKDNGFTIVCYTGYQAEELPYIFRLSELLLQNVDVLVDGMFIKELLTPIDEPYKFVGSSNQRIINVQRSLDTGFIELWTDEDTRRVVNDEGYLRGLEQN